MSGCFIYLVNHTEQAVMDGARSLRLLHTNYLNRFPTPILLFHEAALTEGMKTRLASEALVMFVPVDFSGYPVGAGYNHMCRFFAGAVFQHPALDPYDYFCRLDTDSFILAPVVYDLFEFAERAGIYYGYLNDEIRERPEFCAGLWKTIEEFVGWRPEDEGRLYYTNFEVCYLPWFRGDLWQRYFRHIDEAGGIYAHRWGDHTIRYAGVKLFMPLARVRQFAGIQYSHQGIGASHAA